MKKTLSVLFLLVFSSIFLLTACGGKSTKQVVISYINPVSYKEKAFYEAVFPEGEEKMDEEKVIKAFDMFVESHEMIKRYFDGRVFEDEEGKEYAAYFNNTYNPLVVSYVAEATAFVQILKDNKDVVLDYNAMADFTNKFVDVHNGYVELLKKY